MAQTTVSFHHKGIVLTTISLADGLPLPREGEEVVIDREYIITNIRHDYSKSDEVDPDIETAEIEATISEI